MVCLWRKAGSTPGRPIKVWMTREAQCVEFPVYLGVLDRKAWVIQLEASARGEPTWPLGSVPLSKASFSLAWGQWKEEHCYSHGGFNFSKHVLCLLYMHFHVKHLLLEQCPRIAWVPLLGLMGHVDGTITEDEGQAGQKQRSTAVLEQPLGSLVRPFYSLTGHAHLGIATTNTDWCQGRKQTNLGNRWSGRPGDHQLGQRQKVRKSWITFKSKNKT